MLCFILYEAAVLLHCWARMQAFVGVPLVNHKPWSLLEEVLKEALPADGWQMDQELDLFQNDK